MKIQVAFAVLFFGSFVSANSGIFDHDGQIASPVQRSPEAVPVESGLHKKATNSDRLRRGLPPLAPTRRHGSSHHGHGVTKSDGTHGGYIGQRYDGQHSYTLTHSRNTALHVKLPSSSPYGGSFNLLALNGPDHDHPYLGAVGARSGYRFAHGQRGSAYLTGTGTAPANSPPSSHIGSSMESSGYRAPGESQIWSMDCRTHEISAQWTDTDSSQHPTSLYYDPGADYLGLNSEETHFGSGAYGVSFTFVPL
ncbi:hypothetical protein C8R43DRAFT_1109809 [Mycena crocata]|nr:hypothetical protein C8R43DRAFT_1109809 [Mycena crocata]